MNIHHAELLKIASILEASNPLLAYRLEAQVKSLASGRISRFHKFAAKPSVDFVKEQIKHLVDVMKKAQHELESSLSEDDAAFMAFFDKPFKEEKELKSAFEDVEKLMKTASFIVKTASTHPRMANLSEFFTRAKEEILGHGYDESQFFWGSDDVLEQLKSLQKNPDKETVNGIIAQLEAFIQQGEELLNKATEYDDSDINPEGKGITLEGEEEINPDGIDVDFSEDEGPEEVRAVPELEGYELEKIVQHYVDMLQKALKDQDMKSVNKFLKELFTETKANVEEETAKVAARKIARNRLLPILVRFAHARPSSRPILLPYLRTASKKHAAGKVEVIKVHHNGHEEPRGSFEDEKEAGKALDKVVSESDTKSAYVKKGGKKIQQWHGPDKKASTHKAEKNFLAGKNSPLKYVDIVNDALAQKPLKNKTIEVTIKLLAKKLDAEIAAVATNYYTDDVWEHASNIDDIWEKLNDLVDKNLGLMLPAWMNEMLGEHSLPHGRISAKVWRVKRYENGIWQTKKSVKSKEIAEELAKSISGKVKIEEDDDD